MCLNIWEELHGLDMMKVALISMLLAYCKMKYYIIQTSNNDNSHKGIAQTGKGVKANVGEYNAN